MSKEKEILHRFFKGESQRSIAAVLRVSRNTVAKVVKACHEHPLEMVWIWQHCIITSFLMK